MNQKIEKSVFEGSLLAPIIEMLPVAQTAACPIKEKIGENEVVISEFSLIEKAILLARDKAVDNHNQRVLCLNEESDIERHKAEDFGDHISSQLFKKMLGENIQYRLGYDLTEKHTSFGMRENWQIVGITANANDCDDCDGCDMKGKCELEECGEGGLLAAFLAARIFGGR